MITKSDILKYFEERQTDIFYAMKNCDHGDLEHKNPYHLEGSVWKHTEMVMDALEDKDVNNMVAALLHDVGKIYTREKIDDRVWFKQHQSRGTFEAIDILIDMEKYFEYSLNKINILNIINLHHLFFDHLKNGKNIDEDSIEILVKKLYGFGYKFFLNLKNVCIADIHGRQSKYGQLDTEELIIRTHDKLYEFFDKKQYTEKNNSPQVIFLIGLPYSGKTTFIKKYLLNKNYVYISRDDLITNVYPDIPYHEAFAKVNHEEINNQFQQNLVETVRKRSNFIIDMTNLSRKSRRQKLSYIPNQYKKIAIVNYVGKKELKRRMEERSDKIIGMEALDTMINSFTVPLFDEFDEIQYTIYI